MTRVVATCRFCSSPAIGRVALSRGCVAYPEDREQDLCEHHLRKATPLGDMQLIADYTYRQTLTREALNADLRKEFLEELCAGLCPDCAAGYRVAWDGMHWWHPDTSHTCRAMQIRIVAKRIHAGACSESY